VGAYYSRAGNSVDQALLLATLLDAAGIDTRFATGAIDAATADELLAAAVTDEAGLRAQAAMGLFGRLPGGADAVPALPRAEEYVPIYETAGPGEVEAWLSSELADGLAAVDSAAVQAGVTLPTGFTPLPADEQEQHTWLQASLDGGWVDLDPSLPGVAVGDTLATLATTMEAIPDERAHVVEIVVTGERLVDGTLVQEEQLAVSEFAHELAGKPLVISNIDSASMTELTSAFEQVLDVQTYNPVLMVGRSSYAGERFTISGGAEDSGGLLGGDFFDTSETLDEVTAQWVDVIVRSPGRAPVTARREVFDRVDPEARVGDQIDAASLAVLESMDLGADGVPGPADIRTALTMVVSTGMPSLRAEVLNDEREDLATIPFSHHLLTELAGLDVAVPLGVRPFVDGPTITALSVAPRMADDGEIGIETAIDILHRSRGVASTGADVAVSTPAAVPGVLAHVTERIMGGEAGANKLGGASVSVGAVFDAAEAAGLALRAVDAASVESLALPAAARRHLEQSLAAGWIAIAPERPVSIEDREHSGWWLVHPLTGRTVDQLDDGRGVDAHGYEAVLIGIAVVTIPILARLARDWYEDQKWEEVNLELMDELTF
jgi:hypothetical protein